MNTEQESAFMTESESSHPVLRTVRSAFGSILARIYLAVCAILLVWSVVVSSGDQPDASFAGVWPLFATAPVSLVVLVLPLPDHMSVFFAAVVLGALVNAALIGWCARALGRGRGSGPTA